MYLSAVVLGSTAVAVRMIQRLEQWELVDQQGMEW
jgi:hypothetical protein